VTLKSDGCSTIDDLRLYDAKIRLYLIGFLFFVVEYLNFLEYPGIIYLTDMLSGTNYSVNKVKHDLFMIILLLLFCYMRIGD
jgi:hypothetical protein